MKKYLIIINVILFSAIITKGYAQTNLSFERWTNRLGVSDPEGWYTQNVLVLGGADSLSCRASSDAIHGYKSIRVRAVALPFNDTTFVLPSTISQQFISTARPKSFRFFYKGKGSVNDSFFASLNFHKGSIKSNNFVGLASALLPVTDEWTAVEINVNWNSTEAYDTAVLIFYSPASLSAELYIDNVDLSEYGAGVNHIEGISLPVFIHHRLQLPFSLKESVSTARIYSTSGQLLMQTAPGETDVSALPAGIYVISLQGKNGQIVYSGKFLKQ